MAEAEPAESEVPGPVGDYAPLYILGRLLLQSQPAIPMAGSLLYSVSSSSKTDVTTNSSCPSSCI
ncbi:hypothetical protein FQV26_05125 [Planococcus sp. CPCC 101016]|nr:hypothetical protein FQV26_05125 [Planococcus sp. CPCC 101016]